MKHLRTESRGNRTGYTLIEMLIAVSLVAVLMTVVWGLMSMYTTLQTVGSEVTAEQQLVRSVLQLIQHDLNSIPLASPQQQEASTDPFAAFAPVLPPIQNDSNVSGGSETVFEIADLIRNENIGPGNVELQGTRDTIRITIPHVVPQSIPTTESDVFAEPAETATLQEGVAPSVREFQSIVYQLQSFQNSETTALPTGLYRTQANAARLKSLLGRQASPDGASVPQGIRLGQTLIEELLFPTTDDGQSSSAVVEPLPTCDLIPDVVGLEFRYHDGNIWQRRWQAKRASQLPVAIEVTIDVISAQQLIDLQALSQTTQQPGKLERYLKQAFTRSEPERRRLPTNPLLDGLTITPHRYTSIILLDTAKEISSQPQGLDLGEFGL